MSRFRGAWTSLNFYKEYIFGFETLVFANSGIWSIYEQLVTTKRRENLKSHHMTPLRFWFRCSLDEDFRFIMPRADLCWTLDAFINFALWNFGENRDWWGLAYWLRHCNTAFHPELCTLSSSSLVLASTEAESSPCMNYDLLSVVPPNLPLLPTSTTKLSQSSGPTSAGYLQPLCLPVLHLVVM